MDPNFASIFSSGGLTSSRGKGCTVTSFAFWLGVSFACPSDDLGSGAKKEAFPEQSPKSLRLLKLTMVIRNLVSVHDGLVLQSGYASHHCQQTSQATREQVLNRQIPEPRVYAVCHTKRIWAHNMCPPPNTLNKNRMIKTDDLQKSLVRKFITSED